MEDWRAEYVHVGYATVHHNGQRIAFSGWLCNFCLLIR